MFYILKILIIKIQSHMLIPDIQNPVRLKFPIRDNEVKDPTLRFKFDKKIFFQYTSLTNKLRYLENDKIFPNKYILRNFIKKLKFLQTTMSGNINLLKTVNYSNNNIVFNFVPLFIPYFISCALTCLNLEFTEDSTIREPDYTKEGYSSRFYSDYFITNSHLQISFKEIFRNTKYKMRYIIERGQWEQSQRNSTIQEINDFESGSSINEFIVVESDKNKCIQLTEITDPSATSDINFNLSDLVNSCQATFQEFSFYEYGINSDQMWKMNGYPLCSNLDLSIYPSGYSLETYFNKLTKYQRNMLYFLSNL